MIIRDLNAVRISIKPPKTYSPLIVEADAILPFTITGQFLQAITWGHPHVVQSFRGVEQSQFAPCDTMKTRRKPSGEVSLEEPFGFLVAETLDHSHIITQRDTIVKR